jgi:thiamine-phosphate pyrophosphorylase
MEMKTFDNIKGGIYLVVDPAMELSVLSHKLSAALKGGLAAVQLWNNWLPETDKINYINKVAGLCHDYDVPLLINEQWELLASSAMLDGVHFDTIPSNYHLIKQSVNRPFLAGITCSGNLDVIRWSDANAMDYISFCAMFPSPSAGSCDIVMPSTVRQARDITTLPFFVSGGISPDNIPLLSKKISFEGVAVISGVMSADDPLASVISYKNSLNLINP